jgi:hypothetical protein
MSLEAPGVTEEQTDSSKAAEPTHAAEQQDDSPMTTEDLVSFPGYDAEHPLICIPGGDFPNGSEAIFRHAKTGEAVHAVFPEGVAAPEDRDGRFAMHGHYQGIQKRREGRIVKRVPKDYRYFVVSSWENSK